MNDKSERQEVIKPEHIHARVFKVTYCVNLLPITVNRNTEDGSLA